MAFPTPGAIQGLCVAYGADAYAASPTWERIDTSTPDVGIGQIRIRRGRTYITDQTGAGTLEADFWDTKGLLDPTNSTGPLYPMNPNCPIAYGLYNPVADSYASLFRGMVQAIPTTITAPSTYSTGTLKAADMLALLAVSNIPPGLDFDASATPGTTANVIGDTTYAATDVQSRIKALLADAGVPAGLTDVFSGNVNVQGIVEPPGTTTLELIQNAADAEFPLVRNYYIDKTGVFNFKGRLARFNPTDPTYGINTWHVGDTAAVAAHSSWGLIQTLAFDRDITKVINDAVYTPQGIADADIAGMEVTDAGSITEYGTRSISGTELITAGGIADGLDALDETKLFNTFLVDNFHDAQTRINRLTFTNPVDGAPNATAQWLLLCGIEISDVVVVTTTHPGGGGFNLESYFVEGITYTLDPLRGSTVNVTLALDLSPAAYYTTNPF